MTEEKESWEDYYSRIIKLRKDEAAALWGKMEEDGVDSDTFLGLDFIHFSQNKKDWIYKTEFKDGLNKPVFDYENNKFSFKAINTNLGEYILFNYDLLHSGLVNKSNNTRCSLEMTFFYSSL